MRRLGIGHGKPTKGSVRRAIFGSVTGTALLSAVARGRGRLQGSVLGQALLTGTLGTGAAQVVRNVPAAVRDRFALNVTLAELGASQIAGTVAAQATLSGSLWAQGSAVRETQAVALRARVVPVHALEVVNEVAILSDGAGGWDITNVDYTAHVNAAGYLDSLAVGGVETMGAATVMSPALTAASFTVTADAVQANCESSSKMKYTFRPNGVTITVRNFLDSYSTFIWKANSATLGCELLNDKGSLRAGDAIWFVESGEVRGLPAHYSERQQKIAWHYPGFALDGYFERWGADFNYEEAGHLGQDTGFGWRRNLLTSNQDSNYRMTIRPTSTTATLRAVPFIPQTTKVASLYYTTESIGWTIDLGVQANYQYLLDAGFTALNLDWTVWDVHDAQVSTGTGTVTLAAGSTNQAVTINTNGKTGYFLVEFGLSGGQMFRSSLKTRFTVAHEIVGMRNRDDTLSVTGNYSDYAQVAMIGIGAIREDHNADGHFPTTDPNDPTNFVQIPGASPPVWINKTNMDAVMNHADQQATLYGLTWWYTMVTTNGYSAAQLQAMYQYLTTTYNDRCTVMEFENEPNFSYSAANYSLALEAVAAGIAAGGGGVTLLAPGCVSVAFSGTPGSIEFLTQIYSDGNGTLLGGVSTHTYPGNGESWEQYGNPIYLQQLRDLMTANGDGSKLLWMTEQGYLWSEQPRSMAARYAVRQFVNGWRRGIDPSRHYYFHPQYRGFESWYQAKGGEVGSRNSWTPLGSACRFLAENTFGKTLSADIATPYRGIFLTRFTGGSDDVIVAWTYDFPFDLTVTTPGYASTQDWMGNAVTPGTSGSDKVFALSGEPIYIHVSTGSAFTVVTPGFGTNFAAVAAGSTATASTADGGNVPGNAIDGFSEPSNSRSFWKSTQVFPSFASPDWLQVDFGQSRTIRRFIALSENPTTGSGCPNDWQFQVDVAGSWQTVASGTDTAVWILHGEFAPVTTTKVRLLVTQINDGWFQDSMVGKQIIGGPTFTRYTESQTRIVELECYDEQGGAPAGAQWFVSPTGTSGNTGAIGSPWSLAHAAAGAGGAIQPGDTVWLRSGNYVGTTTFTLAGTAADPIVFRNYQDERATLEWNSTGNIVQFAPSSPAAYIWLWGLEVFHSDTDRVTTETGSFPSDIPRSSSSGFNLDGGESIKLINCIVHDCGNGIGAWTGSPNTEIYGCLSYHNGWQAPDRGHGHALYCQNDTGTKVIRECILFNNFQVGLHLYSESSQLRNFDIRGTCAFNGGKLCTDGQAQDMLLESGQVISNVSVDECYMYFDDAGAGDGASSHWGQTTNALHQDLSVTNCYFYGRQRPNQWTNVTMTGNTILSKDRMIELIVDGVDPATWTIENNTYWRAAGSAFLPFNQVVNAAGEQFSFNDWKASEGHDDASTFTEGSFPSSPAVFVRPNTYEPGRAHLIVFNWGSASTVAVNLSTAGLANGQSYEIRKAENYYGAAVHSGTYNSAFPTINLAMMDTTVATPVGGTAPPSTLSEFGVFIVIPG